MIRDVDAELREKDVKIENLDESHEQKDGEI